MRLGWADFRKFCWERRNPLVSVVVHMALLLIVVGGLHSAPHVAPYRLPGTKQGVTALTYFAAGSRMPVPSDSLQKQPEKVKRLPLPVPVPSVPKMEAATNSGAQSGLDNAPQSGLGEGDISIALETYFPYPHPNLSGLPRGTKGDVILDAVVDEEGKISKLTLVRGLGSPVDEEVIAAVQQWRYTPAKRQGVPVSSERELHFHYERG